MRIQKPHPWWPSERDFDCPSCSNPLADMTDREELYDEVDNVQCPYCNANLRVELKVRIEYDVEEL
jgi:DNA-directed RNA polymerase subunit RPC12/RpoP